MMGFGNIDPREAMRMELDKMMGAQRNDALDEQAKPKKFSAREVCKLFLAGCSPWQLLEGTKSEAWVQTMYAKKHHKGTDYDPGVLVTDLNMKAEYDKLTQEQKDKYGYENELFIALEELVTLCDRKMQRNVERLEQKEGAKVTEDDVKQLVDIETKIKEKTDLAEQLGEEGEVDESMKMMQEIEALQEIKNTIERGTAAAMQKQTNRTSTICDMTGELIDGAAAADDNWMQSHFTSKDYLGWKELREKFAELKAKNDGRGPARGVSGYRHDDDGKSKDRRGDRGRDRDRDRRGDRDRDRRSDRDRRDRDRDRDRRDRDRDRDRRDRDRRDRRRSRSRD